jgi:uncharacterized protein (TIGR02145 family)
MIIEKISMFILLIIVFSCKKETPPPPPPPINENIVSDIDGNVYSFIEIGTQTWMTENLKTTKYCNGESITNVTNEVDWANTTDGAWADYANESQNENIYGKLYNWFAINDSRNICPCGWHVPSDEEWTVLTDYLGGESVAGGKMKSISSYWQNQNIGASNSSGFNGLPAGRRVSNNSFQFLNTRCFFWSSTLNASNSAWARFLVNSEDYALRSFYLLSDGLSVRCIKD